MNKAFQPISVLIFFHRLHTAFHFAVFTLHGQAISEHCCLCL